MKKVNLIILFSLMMNLSTQAQKQPMANFYLNNREPLITKPYVELPLGSVRAEGWLKEQLFRMKNGMTGHLDSLYSKVMGPRNGWLGGDGDVWERGPYWNARKHYRTGDTASRDEDGLIWVHGRNDGVMNIAGHRIGCAEVEKALMTHKAVAEALPKIGRASCRERV